jgi:signal transduction histidine kinase
MRADISRLERIANGSSAWVRPAPPGRTRSSGRRRLLAPGVAAHRVEIPEQLEEGLPMVRTEREILAWTVENLLKNATDAILKAKRDGHIYIRTTKGNPTGVRIVVEDDGPGIPESIQSRIFEPGFSTKERGWGLGLALARRIVEDYHGGRLRLLRSTPGVRTVFAVDLPDGGR